MSTPPKPSRHAIFSSVLIFVTIVGIGSFSSVIESVSMALVFLSIPWFTFYFLDWLGGDTVRRMRSEMDSQGKTPTVKPKPFRW